MQDPSLTGAICGSQEMTAARFNGDDTYAESDLCPPSWRRYNLAIRPGSACACADTILRPPGFRGMPVQVLQTRVSLV